MFKKIFALIIVLLCATTAFADVSVKNASTSKIIPVFVADSSLTTGAGKTAIAYNTATLACAYYEEGAGTGATAITMASSTLGTYTSGCFKEIDATKQPGWYEFCPPDASLDGGIGKFVDFWCGGVANMSPVILRVALSPDVNTNSVTIDAINAAAIAADAIGSSEIATDAIGAAELASNAIGALEIADAAIDAATYAATGTAQSATASTLRLASAETYADNELANNTAIQIVSATTGVGQVRCIGSYVGSTDTATLIDNWTTTPTGTITYGLIPSANCQAKINSLAADVITAASIATDAIGAAEIAADAIGASELAASAIGASELATDAIGSDEIATDAIGSSEIQTDAIGAAELAADSITASEIATDAIGAAEVATDAIGAAELAANAITTSEFAQSAADKVWDTTVRTVTSAPAMSSGTAQSVASKSIRLAAGETYEDSSLNRNAGVLITSATTGKGQFRCVCSYVSTTDSAGLCTPWKILPTGTITYSVIPWQHCDLLEYPTAR